MTLSRNVRYRLGTHQGQCEGCQLTEPRGPDFLPDSHLLPEVNPAGGHIDSFAPKRLPEKAGNYAWNSTTGLTSFSSSKGFFPPQSNHSYYLLSLSLFPSSFPELTRYS